jgi:hypothetical protein
MLQYGNVSSLGSDLYLLYSLCRRCHSLCIYISVVLRVWLRVTIVFGPILNKYYSFRHDLEGLGAGRLADEVKKTMRVWPGFLRPRLAMCDYNEPWGSTQCGELLNWEKKH